jgi:dCMP deaminase
VTQPTDKDLKYMDLVETGSKIFSTCSKRQYMALIVDESGHVIGMGYNGGPKGMRHCTEGGCKRLYETAAPGSVYENCIAIHAEANAILHSDYTARCHGAKIYVNGPPCFGCAKLIANSGIRTVVYKTDASYADYASVKVFMIEAGLELVEVDADN